MAALLGRLLILAIIAYLIYLWWKPKPGDIGYEGKDGLLVSCLPRQHPANMGIDIHTLYVKQWYDTHELSSEMDQVAALGTKEDMKQYLAYLAHWMQRATFR